MAVEPSDFDTAQRRMLLATLLFVSTIRLGTGVRNYTKDEMKVNLPASFIVSTTLDVGPSKNKTGSAHIVQSEIDVTELKKDRRVENDKFYNFQRNKLKDLVNTTSVNKNSPKINFYSMDCAAGNKCTAIIPGPKTPVPSTKHRSQEEIKNYLRKHGLENGFNYSNDDRINKHNVVARYFKGESENQDRIRNARKGRKIGNKFYDYEDYWPGSEYRPKKVNNMLPSKSKSKIYKYGIKSPINDRYISNSWGNGPSSTYNYEDDYPSSHELPYPSFSKSGHNANIHYPTNRPYSQTETKNKGVWNRYSSSIISQYDKDTKDWVKISTSNSALGSGFVNTHHKPSYQKGSNTKGPNVSLTVLGLPGIDEPYYYTKKPSRPSYGQSYIPTQQDYQNHFSQSPDHPFPPIAPSKPSVSFPLNVLPFDLSVPLSIFSNDGINNTNIYANATISNSSLHSNQTQVPSLFYLPPTLTVAENITTTVKPEPVRRVSLPITQRTQLFQQTQQSTTNTEDGGGGDGGGSGGGVVTNAYAVMAAVGAGLIPASIAAILPVLLGRRKKRSLENIEKRHFQRNLHSPVSPVLQGILEDLSYPKLQSMQGSPSYYTLLEARSPPDPFIQLLLKGYPHNKQILR